MNLIGDAVAVVALVGFGDDVEAGLRVFRFEELRIGAAARNRRDVADQQNLAGIAAPQQFVTVDAPVIGGFADRGENLGGIEMSAAAGRRSARYGRAGTAGRK